VLVRLILVDCASASRIQFSPVALSRPVGALRCGMTTLAEKLVAGKESLASPGRTTV
jgi:hypothetical protein